MTLSTSLRPRRRAWSVLRSTGASGGMTGLAGGGRGGRLGATASGAGAVAGFSSGSGSGGGSLPFMGLTFRATWDQSRFSSELSWRVRRPLLMNGVSAAGPRSVRDGAGARRGAPPPRRCRRRNRPAPARRWPSPCPARSSAAAGARPCRASRAAARRARSAGRRPRASGRPQGSGRERAGCRRRRWARPPGRARSPRGRRCRIRFWRIRALAGSGWSLSQPMSFASVMVSRSISPCCTSRRPMEV